MPSVPFGVFQPEPDKLLRLISSRIDEAMLQEIAAADYGYDADDHLLHLRRIRDEGSFTIPMRWEPREVLELIRWSQPEDPEWKPGAPGVRGHWMRAFACTALLRAAGEVDNQELREGWNETLIQLIESLNVLGAEFNEPASALLAWLIIRFESDADTQNLAFLGVGLLWFGLHHQLPVPDETIVSLSLWIVAREKHARECQWQYDGWLLGTTNYNQQHAAWKRLGGAFADLDLASRSPAARDWVRLIGNELAEPDQSARGT
jgi:hypothetical protein